MSGERAKEAREIAKEIKERWDFELQDSSQTQDDIKRLVELVDELSTHILQDGD